MTDPNLVIILKIILWLFVALFALAAAGSFYNATGGKRRTHEQR